MYSQYFGLNQDPFSIAPDPHYLFMSERHREALAHLLYGVAGQGGNSGGTGGGFVLLTGDIGTGKTTICRCFLEQIPQGCHVAYIFNPKLTVIELLQSICEEFHIVMSNDVGKPRTAKDYIDALNEFLLKSHAAGQRALLIIDEAQNLEPDVLEQLRLLTNLETSERKLLQIVLIGQPELREKLAHPELEQLAQRVIARFHLDALSVAETTQYIGHRLGVAGHTGGPLPFDAAALKRIHSLTRGVPRLINLLCGRALLGAWASGTHRVDSKVVNKAADEVFGPELAHKPARTSGIAAYAIGGTAFVASAVLIAYLVWGGPAVPQVPVIAESPKDAAPANAVGAKVPPVEDIDQLVALLPTNINAAWRELGPMWKLPETDTDPCQFAAEQQTQCYSTTSLTMPMLRQLDRPGALKLQAGNSPAVYAVLVGLNERTATLSVGAKLHAVRTVSLAKLWRGDFATYWQEPTGYRADLRDGSTGPVIDHLATQLALLDGTSTSVASTVQQVLNTPLRDRVRAFQRAQGLVPDGQPGPMTFMHLDSATGTNEPRLKTDQP